MIRVIRIENYQDRETPVYAEMQVWRSFADWVYHLVKMQPVAYDALIAAIPDWEGEYLSAIENVQPDKVSKLTAEPLVSSHGRHWFIVEVQ